MRPEDLLLAPQLTPEQVEKILKPYGIKDPQAADRNLQLMAEELPTREMLARLIGSLLLAAQKSPDPDAALNYFERFLSTFSPRTSLLTFLGETPEALELIILLCGTSPFSAEILIRNPENFYWLFDQLGPSWIKSRERYRAEATQMMDRFSESTDRLRALARYQRREMLRIASRDILRLAPLTGTVAELSYLADTVIHLVYENCWQRLTEKFGTPVWTDAEGNEQAARFTILGMGKLGGGELNYSSDIDLIYCYDGEQGHTVRGDHGNSSSWVGSLPSPEFFIRLAQAITHELSGFTEEGYFYRVDLRLRPEGSTGRIAVSLNACRNYYSSWGETFERMALVKARPVGGSQELGDEFCAAFNPFVYRSFLDFAALEEIQEIKGRIETKLGSRKKQEVHVKLGAGGIREIEFFVQALQLIYGGRNLDLQERGTIRALEKLLEHEYLSTREYEELLQAYLFLRDLEHKLQMVLHLQTHELPSSPEELYKCARRMGLTGSAEKETVDKLKRLYQGHVRKVSRIFQDLIRFKRQGVARGQMREAALVMNKNLSETGAFTLLQPYRFRDLKSAWHQLGLLRDAPAFSHSPSKMRNLLANLLTSLLKALAESPDPDAGLSAFEQFAESFGDRESLYTLLNEKHEALNRLVLLLASSQPLSSFLCRKPEFFDSLVRTDLFVENKSLQEFRQDLRERMEAPMSLEERQRELRNFQQTEWFRIGMKDLLGQISRNQAGKQLSALAEACLDEAFELACAQLEAEKGASQRDWYAQHFAVMALGKFGGNDLSYSSDLDLVYFFQVEDLAEAGEAQKRCVQLAERLDAILSVSTGEGSIYRIDTRLRPEGRKGELVVALHRYQEYLARRAENWERLALVRHRFVLGKGRLLQELRCLVRDFVYQPELPAEVIKELVHIRHRMEVEVGKELGKQFHLKSGAGGLVDIEFSAQLLQLKHGGQIPLLRQSNTLAALRLLAKEGILPESSYRDFLKGYEFLRLLENRLRLTAPYGSAVLSRAPEALERLARLCRFERKFKAGTGERFEAQYLAATQKIRQAYGAVVSKLTG
jgi:glutamate-ammonia-ligase adenylyltransferase